MFYAQIRLLDPESGNADGEMCVRACDLQWQQVPYLEPGDCNHESTMCRRCVDTWECDWEVVTPSWV